MTSVSIIIPVKDMGPLLIDLLESIEQTGLLNQVQDVIIVNDASIDDTESLAMAFFNKYPHKIKIITHKENQGRFLSRKEGALAASGYDLMFIDARVVLPSSFKNEFLELSKTHKVMMGVPIYSEKSAFSLYWKLTHEFIFKKNILDARAGFLITKENFETYVKGTTLFYCSKEIFLKACDLLNNKTVLNDDLDLLLEIVKEYPIFVSDKLGFHWEPRQTYRDFLARLWERGPSFIDHHVIENQTRFSFFFFIYNVFFIAGLYLLIKNPRWALFYIGLCLLLVLLSSIIFSRNIKALIKIAPLHLMSFLTFFTGAQLGFVKLLLQRMKKNHKGWAH